MEYTKGEWKVASSTFVYALNKQGSNRFDANVQPGVDDEDARTSEAELRANAYLIVAAPDMYEALSRFFTQYKELGGISGMNQGVIMDVEMALDKAEGKE